MSFPFSLINKLFFFKIFSPSVRFFEIEQLDNKVVLEFTDNSDVLENGAMGLIVEDGTMVTDEVIVE